MNESTRVRRIGHSTVLIELPHLTILTDPVLFDRIGISILGLPTMGIKRLHPPAITLQDLPDIDLVIISHAHLDHLDTATLRALTHRQPYKITCITAFNTSTWLKKFQRKEVYELDRDQELEIFDLKISAGETRHRGARFPWTPDRSQESTMGAGHNAYLIEWMQNHQHKEIVFGGDTAYTHALKHRSDRKVDLALMPIGAYEPFRFQHCTPEESLKMAHDIHAQAFGPIHRNTFKISTEPVTEPIERLQQAIADTNMVLARDKIGGEYTIE